MNIHYYSANIFAITKNKTMSISRLFSLILLIFLLSACGSDRNTDVKSLLSNKINHTRYQLLVKFDSPPNNAKIDLKKAAYENQSPYLFLLYFSDYSKVEMCASYPFYFYPCVNGKAEHHSIYIYGEAINDTTFLFNIPDYPGWRLHSRADLYFNKTYAYINIIDNKPDRNCNKTLHIKSVDELTNLEVELKSGTDYCLVNSVDKN